MDADPVNLTAQDYLFRVGSPYLFIGEGEPDRLNQIPSFFYSRPGLDVCVRHLRGRKMRTTAALMDEMGAALQLFDGFGENWHALEECLGYMDEWLPADAYVLVIEGAEDVLAAQPSDLAAFMTTVNAAGEFWSSPVIGNGRYDRPSKPFHVLMHVGGAPAATKRFVDSATAVGVPMRLGVGTNNASRRDNAGDDPMMDPQAGPVRGGERNAAWLPDLIDLPPGSPTAAEILEELRADRL